MPSVTVTVTGISGQSASVSLPYTVTAGTYFGACVTNPGGESLAAAQTVITKWGTGAAVRQFYAASSTFGTPKHPAGASVVHSSYKPLDSSVNSGSMDAQIEALVAATPNGDILEFWHESNNDGLTGSAIANRIACKNRLYDIKQTVKPGVLVAHTQTGGFWASYGNDATRDTWLATARGDLHGLDADGVNDPTGPTYDTTYADEVANVQRYLTRFAFKWPGWTTPEFCTCRQPWDTTGFPRADWYETQAGILSGAGSYAVMAYDYNTSSHNTATDYAQLKVGTPEFAAFSALI